MSIKSWFERAIDDSNYDVTSDPDEMNRIYICENCGCRFTLDEAFGKFYNYFNGDLSYNGCGYDGSLCGDCAAEEENSKFEDLDLF